MVSVSWRGCRAMSRFARAASFPTAANTAQKPKVSSCVPRVNCASFGSSSDGFGSSSRIISPRNDHRSCHRSFVSSASVANSVGTSSKPPHARLHGFDKARQGLSDLCDVFHPEPVDDSTTGNRQMQFVEPGYLRDFGGVKRFSGPAVTIRCFENNPLVREALNEPGTGRVLVIDGGGSRRCALLGDNLAAMAMTNGWAGVVVNGCIRDAQDIAKLKIGVKAISTHPLKSSKRDAGQRNVPVQFAGVTITPGDWVYADMDGVVVGGRTKFEL